MHIFVSKPNSLNVKQQEFWDALRQVMKKRGLECHCLGDTDFPNKAPLNAVKKLMSKCQGAIILGLRQTHIFEGVKKEGTPDEFSLNETYLGTEWNHIEAGMAFMHGLPLLILKETGVNGGIFDAGNTDLFIHQLKLDENYNFHQWLISDAFQQPFEEWIEEISEGAQAVK